MNQFKPPDERYEQRVRDSFARQLIMATIGATLERVEPGSVEIALPYRADLTQQHGFIHAGIIGAIVDSACGYAAFSLMPAEAAVLTIEYKLNLLSPAAGEKFLAIGAVKKRGNTITVCAGEVIAYSGAATKTVALMTATVMAVYGREGIKH